MVGLQLRGQTCGPDVFTFVRSEVGFGVKWLIPPNPVGFALYNNKHLAYDQPEETTPVDPAGPYCYRDRTKTC